MRISSTLPKVAVGASLVVALASCGQAGGHITTRANDVGATDGPVPTSIAQGNVPFASVVKDIEIPLDHEGSYDWSSPSFVLPAALQNAQHNGPDSFSVSYRIENGTAGIDSLKSVPHADEAGGYILEISFTASAPTRGAQFHIIGVTVNGQPGAGQ